MINEKMKEEALQAYTDYCEGKINEDQYDRIMDRIVTEAEEAA